MHLIDLAFPLEAASSRPSWPVALASQLTEASEACALLIKGGIQRLSKNPLAAGRLFQEQLDLPYEGKFFDKGRTFTRRSYKTLKFGQTEVGPSGDFAQPTVVSFNSVPQLQQFLGHLDMFQDNLSSAQGIEYFVSRREQAADGGMMGCASRLGWHGDSQRRILSMCLGHPGILKFAWRLPGTSANLPKSHTEIFLDHGDVYLLSEKATGSNWKKRSLLRVVHTSFLYFQNSKS